VHSSRPITYCKATTLHTIHTMPKAFYRRQLPHLQRDYKSHFLTFCTDRRWILPQHARSVLLDRCLHDQGTKIDLDVVVVIPDHVHMVFTPLVNEQAMEVCSLAEIMNAIKELRPTRSTRPWTAKGKCGKHVLRSSESLEQKGNVHSRIRCAKVWYVSGSQYPWIWKEPLINPYST
jgi:REP element-mobilizing transposase RayT